MLKIVWLGKLANKKIYWDSFDPATSTWVVSDLKSKSYLSDELLSKHTFLSGQPVVRIAELLHQLLTLNDPAQHGMPSWALNARARAFLKGLGSDLWQERPNAGLRLIAVSQELSALASHPYFSEILQEFKETFPNSSPIFSEMAEAANQFYLDCSKRRKWPSFFVPSFLAQYDNFQTFDKKIIIDLGFHFTERERDLIQKISLKNEVLVLAPGTKEDKRLVLRPYHLLSVGVNSFEEVSIEGSPKVPSPSLWRCSSPESEARKASEYVGELLRKGITPSQIAISASDISIYDQTLSYDLNFEGVGYDRDITSRLSSAGFFRALTARLRLISGEFSGPLIEEVLSLDTEVRNSVEFQSKIKFLHLLDASQMDLLHPKFRKISERLKKYLDKSLGFTEFRELIFDEIQELGESDPEMIAKVGNALLAIREVCWDEAMTLAFWVDYWSSKIKALDFIGVRRASGVLVHELNSVDELSVSHLIVLGCVENSGGESLLSHLNSREMKFFIDQGFYFDTPDRRGRNEAQLRWLVDGPFQNVVLSTSLNNSSGKAVTASPFWLMEFGKSKNASESLEVSSRSQVYRLQSDIGSPRTQEVLDQFRNWKPGRFARLHNHIENELNSIETEKPLDPIKIEISLSASKIESYWECPFQFFANYVLRLGDESPRGLDPEAMDRGKWLHEILERLVSSGRIDPTDTDGISSLIDEVGGEEKKYFSDIWPFAKDKIVRVILRFLEVEQQFQKMNPTLKPKYFEKKVNGFINWSKDKIEFSPNKTIDSKSALFSGVVDRIDEFTTGDLAIVDYKSSDAEISNISSWANAGRFQLPLYSMAVESGLCDFGPTQVAAAQYCSLKSMERSKGFSMESNSGVSVAGTAIKSRVTDVKRAELFAEISAEVARALGRYSTGDCRPIPVKPSICENCNWSQICRAKHLL